MLTLYFDGATEPNPGNSGIGVVGYEEKKWKFKIAENIGFHTNNESEFIALKKGLEKASELGFKHIHAYGDSLLVINIMNQTWKARKPEIIRLHDELKEIIKHFQKVYFTWIRREKNTKADYLSKIGLKNQNIHHVFTQPASEKKDIVFRRRDGNETRLWIGYRVRPDRVGEKQAIKINKKIEKYEKK